MADNLIFWNYSIEQCKYFYVEMMVNSKVLFGYTKSYCYRTVFRLMVVYHRSNNKNRMNDIRSTFGLVEIVWEMADSKRTLDRLSSWSLFCIWFQIKYGCGLTVEEGKVNDWYERMIAQNKEVTYFPNGNSPYTINDSGGSFHHTAYDITLLYSFQRFNTKKSIHLRLLQYAEFVCVYFVVFQILTRWTSRI